MSDTNALLTFISTSLYDTGESARYDANSSDDVKLKETQEAMHYYCPINDIFKQKHAIVFAALFLNARSNPYTTYFVRSMVRSSGALRKYFLFVKDNPLARIEGTL